MKVKMKQNKNSSAIRISSFVLVLFVLFISISVPVFAYTDNSLNGIDFSGQPIPLYEALSPNTWEHAFNVSYNCGSTTYGAGTTIVHARSTSDTIPIFVYAVQSGSSLSFIAIASEPVSVQWSFGSPNSSNYSGENGALTQSPLNSSVYTYSRSYSSSSSVLNVPLFSNSQDGIDAYLDWLENPPVVSSPHSLNTTLPAGNAIIIDVTGNNAEVLSLSSTSALRHKDNWSDGNQMMGYFASAPTSLSSPFDGTHSITWRGVGSPNLFGGYNTWTTTAPLLPTGNYLVIVNPAYPNDNPDSITSNQASNGAIIITCGYCLSAQIVPLSSAWSNGSIVSSSGNLRLDGEYDPNTDSWTFNNSVTGQPQNPVSGGLTDVDAEHITINDWLQNISHQIGSFFAGAIGAVSTLVSAGSDFIHSLSGLYAWLPAPVYSVLVSALILVITIGVIKVFI